MLVTHLVQQSTGRRLEQVLAERFGEEPYGRLGVAMAYATVAGVRALLEATADIERRQWLLGLDDWVTQPGALQLCQSLEDSTLRVAASDTSNRRFHPKVLFAATGPNDPAALLVVGSANLTARGLRKNTEAVTLLKSETLEDKAELESVWRELWAAGHSPADGELEEYEERYEAAKAQRKHIAVPVDKPDATEPEPPTEVLATDQAEIDPAVATVCWIECGSLTGWRRELELKGGQHLFFGLGDADRDGADRNFVVSSKALVPLTLKYRDENGMWRLAMSSEVPELPGLRPTRDDGTVARSPYVAVFTRLDGFDRYRLEFIRVDGDRFEKLRRLSEKNGTLGATSRQRSRRLYGWL